MDVGDGLLGVAADLLQAAEGQQLALVLDVGRDGIARRLDGVVVGRGGGHGGRRGAVRGPGEGGLDGGQRHGLVGLVALGHALPHAHAYAQQVGLHGGRL